jgi:hypothetical protein
MSSPALALTPVPLSGGTGAGATTGTTRQPGHRYHTLCENTDGKQENGEPGRFAGLCWPGAPCFPLSFSIQPLARHGAGGGRQ